MLYDRHGHPLRDAHDCDDDETLKPDGTLRSTAPDEYLLLHTLAGLELRDEALLFTRTPNPNPSPSPDPNPNPNTEDEYDVMVPGETLTLTLTLTPTLTLTLTLTLALTLTLTQP